MATDAQFKEFKTSKRHLLTKLDRLNDKTVLHLCIEKYSSSIPEENVSFTLNGYLSLSSFSIEKGKSE